MYQDVKVDYKKINQMGYKPIEWAEDHFLKPKIIEEPQFTTVTDDEILLGREPYDDEFETKVTYPNPRGRRTTIVICGGQGSGKTVVAKNIVFDNLHFRFGHPILAFDAKADTKAATKPNVNPQFIDIMAKYNIRPGGYNIMHVVPKFMDLFGAWGKKAGNEISISMEDFTLMDKDQRVAIMCQILEVKTDEPAYAVISQIMMAEELPKTPQQFLIQMQDIMEAQKIKSERLKWKFEALINTKKIGVEHFDYYKHMKQRGIVALEGSIGDEKTIETMTQGVMVNLAIYNVVNGRLNEIRKGKRREPIPYIFMDEASNYAGKDGLSAGIMTAVSTKYRAIDEVPGIGSVVVTQFLRELAPKIVSEAELIICPKLTDARDIQIIKDRGSDNFLFDNMYYNPDARPNEFVAFGRNGLSDYRLFKPLPTRSWMGRA